MYLYGTNSNKTVNLGNTKGNNVYLRSYGKNKVTAGDGGNDFNAQHDYSENTIISGKGKDNYRLSGGKNKITDKGGDDYYIITGGVNDVNDKGGNNTFDMTLSDGASYYGKFTTGSGNDTFKMKLHDSEGDLTINSGDGADTLEIYNDLKTVNKQIVTADMGKGNDTVLVDFEEESLYNHNASILNLKTGKGEDKVDIKAGHRNTIDTGDDVDTITVYATANKGSVNIINAGKGNDIIEISGGENTIYGDAGNDTITIDDNFSRNTIYGGNDTINVYGGHNNIYASVDTINLAYGYTNNVYTVKGGNKINISRTTVDNPLNTIHLQKGDNTVELTGIEGRASQAKVYISAGKNTINAKGYSVLSVYCSEKPYKTAQTINITEYAVADNITLGKGADIITNSADYAAGDASTTHAGGGNDKFYISNGSNKILYGEEGNDYFEITSGDSHKIYGGLGNDTIKVTGGTNHYIEANGGNDTIIVSGGSGYTIYGYEGKDTFNISGGDSGTLYGGDDNDTFNITGGTNTSIDGEKGNDIYNLNMQSGSVDILESGGTNTVNVAKNFKGTAEFSSLVVTEAKYNVKFDKSYTLTSGANVKDDVITTSDSDITLYRTFLKDEGVFAPGASYQFVTNVQNEISDKSIDDRYVKVSTASFNSVNIGGKNYTLNFDKLQQDLVAWFGEAGHTGYSDSDAVLANGNETDINSLMAVYTKDTAGCFVKA